MKLLQQKCKGIKSLKLGIDVSEIFGFFLNTLFELSISEAEDTLDSTVVDLDDVFILFNLKYCVCF